MARCSFVSFVKPFVPFVVKLFLFITPSHSHAQQDTIKIGLLIQDQSLVSVVNAATLAIEKANREGYKTFGLEVRSMEGPWGTGARRSVDLVFGEEVWAVIASADGRNSHLAEQVSAKTQVVFMSAWSGDPTLAQAFVPWYYCILPNYLQQAEVIAGEIAGSGDGGTIIIAGEDYDSRLAASSLRKVLAGYRITEPVIVPDKEISKIKGSGIGTVVIFCQPEQSAGIIRRVKQERKECRIIASLAVAGVKEFSGDETEDFEGALFISPEFYFTEKGRSFSNEYFAKFGHRPGTAAAFAYDAVNIITGASRKAVNRDDLRHRISSMVHEGSTGTIKFDQNGNREGRPELIKAEKGKFVKVKK